MEKPSEQRIGGDMAKTMRTGTIHVVRDGRADHYALGVIDESHLYMVLYDGITPPTEEEIKSSFPWHVRQVGDTAIGLFSVLVEWLWGRRELNNVGFEGV